MMKHAQWIPFCIAMLAALQRTESSTAAWEHVSLEIEALGLKPLDPSDPNLIAAIG